MKDKYFSIDSEPALGNGDFDPDPAERKVRPIDSVASELEVLRDSVAAEPALPDRRDPEAWSAWLTRRRARCTLPGNLAVTLAAAVLAGPFAIVGALITPQQGVAFLVYPIVFAPIIEELLKQSGMIYLVEKKPYRLFAAWQFVFAAVVSATAFAAIENIVYIQAFSMQADAGDITSLARFRWSVCTPMHVLAATIASFGMIRVWRRHVRQNRPAELSDAFGFFAAAMIVHGAYNTWAVLFGPEL